VRLQEVEVREELCHARAVITARDDQLGQR
jgi:hypothetical protein